MKNKVILFLILSQFFASIPLFSQNLEDILNELTDSNEIQLTEATFKAVKIINGQSIETPGKNEMVFSISHRFGMINSGIYDFFGLDETANIRFAFDYGLSDKLAIGIGRSKYEKAYDTYIKYKIIAQQTGIKNRPFTLSVFASTNINTFNYTYPDIKNTYTRKLVYTAELLIARKFSDNFSVQITPGIIHRNIVKLPGEPNDMYYTGIGARFKLTARLSLNAEYFYRYNHQFSNNMQDMAAIGIDIETGGHVFQIMVTNSAGLTEQAFITQTPNKLTDGDLMLGFNISRIFAFNKQESNYNQE